MQEEKNAMDKLEISNFFSLVTSVHFFLPTKCDFVDIEIGNSGRDRRQEGGGGGGMRKKRWKMNQRIEWFMFFTSHVQCLNPLRGLRYSTWNSLLKFNTTLNTMIFTLDYYHKFPYRLKVLLTT